MTRTRLLLLAALLLVCLAAHGVHAVADPPATSDAIHFAALDVYVDAGPARLAAYQIDLAPPPASHATIVGLAGGDHDAFKDPPFYDPAALNAPSSRLIIAAYSTAADLPAGRTRVAQISIAYTGTRPPDYAAKLVVAADPAATPLAHATVTVAAKEPAR